MVVAQCQAGNGQPATNHDHNVVQPIKLGLLFMNTLKIGLGRYAIKPLEDHLPLCFAKKCVQPVIVEFQIAGELVMTEVTGLLVGMAGISPIRPQLRIEHGLDLCHGHDERVSVDNVGSCRAGALTTSCAG